MLHKPKVAVLGSGSWGTVISAHLYKNNIAVTLWSRKKEICEEINNQNTNVKYLNELMLPLGLFCQNDLQSVIESSDIIILSVPSSSIRDVCKQIKPFLSKKHSIVSSTKGFEKDTCKRISEIIFEETEQDKIAVISGPSHAEEVIKELPVVLTVGSNDKDLSRKVRNIFTSPYCSIYIEDHMPSIEIAASLKNMVALGVGIVEGAQLGDNAKAVFITKVWQEVITLSLAMGAHRHILDGIAGLGDLIVTCTSKFSRNWRTGFMLGQGKRLEDVLVEVNMVVEGINATQSANLLMKRYNLSLPIMTNLSQILFKDCCFTSLRSSILS